MARLWYSLAALAVLVCASLVNTHYMGAFTGELTDLLEQAGACAQQGDWQQAAKITDAAMERWEEEEGYLHMVLQHADTDEILLEFCEVRQLLSHREDGGEYSAANERLITQIWLLYEMEQFSLKNLF